MTAHLSVARGWRPQAFGGRSVRQIADPVIEPLWSGIRVLAHVERGQADLRDEAGRPVTRPDILDPLPAAVEAAAAVLDGYLTAQAARSGVGVRVGPTAAAAPSAGEMTRQMLLGGRGPRRELVEALDDAAAGATPAGQDEGLVFVAVDLLLVDDEPLLDVPLLERRRLLGGVLVEGPSLRVGVSVRAPVDPWLGTWRNLGFRSVAYKEANGRYRPGERNEGWATAPIPRG